MRKKKEKRNKKEKPAETPHKENTRKNTEKIQKKNTEKIQKKKHKENTKKTRNINIQQEGSKGNLGSLPLKGGFKREPRFPFPGFPLNIIKIDVVVVGEDRSVLM